MDGAQERQSSSMLILEAPPANKYAPLLMFCEPFVAGGRAHARGGLRGVRTAKDKSGLREGKQEDLGALKAPVCGVRGR